MSKSRLVRWVSDLLFGSQSFTEPPSELKDVLLQLEAENIDWQDILLRGGLTGFSYNVHADLNILLEHLDRVWIDPDRSTPLESGRLRTRAVSVFWTHLQMLLARFLETARRPVPVSNETDESILQTLLSNPQSHSGSFEFRSAAFWGDVARRLLNVHRPFRPDVPALAASHPLDRLVQLYDWTCQARGVRMDPFASVLVPHSEHVGPVHWQSDVFLELFMRDRPNHPLTRAVQLLIHRSLDDFLKGELPSALSRPSPLLTDFVRSVENADRSIRQSPSRDTPPRVVDVFQRLLALAREDALWTVDAKRDPPLLEVSSPQTLLLLETLRITERQNGLLWRLVKNGPVDERRPAHIYSSLDATDSADATTSDDEEEALCTRFPGRPSP